MSEFSIEVDWITSDTAASPLKETASELKIVVGQTVLTRVLDLWSKTVTDRARVPVYPLAAWLAVNWWRLRYETELYSGGVPSIGWRLSHDLPSAGDGFVWPPIRLASDGETIQVSVTGSLNAEWETAHYLAGPFSRSISLASFEGQVDGLITLAIERIQSLGGDDLGLEILWKDVLAERADAETTDWRALEARLGFDAGEAPEPVMGELLRLAKRIGPCARDEIAPLIGNEKPAGMLAVVEELAERRGLEAGITFEGRHRPVRKPAAAHAREMAKASRELLDRPAAPVSDGMLEDLLQVPAQSLQSAPAFSKAPFALAVLGQRGSSLHFRRRSPSGRRFEAARFLADQYAFSKKEPWRPQTDTGTARQKFQRAFAAEFLVPIAALDAYLDGDITQDRFEDAADYFEVSPLLIQAHLANNGRIPAY